MCFLLQTWQVMKKWAWVLRLRDEVLKHCKWTMMYSCKKHIESNFFVRTVWFFHFQRGEVCLTYSRLEKNLTIPYCKELFALLSHICLRYKTRALKKMPLGLGTFIRTLLQVRKSHKKMNLVFSWVTFQSFLVEGPRYMGAPCEC